MNVPLTPLEFLHRAAAYYSRKVAIITEKRRLTYGDYYERCNRLSSALLKSGLEPGQSVVLICPNTHHVLEGYFAISGAGGVYCPINSREQPQFIKQVLDQVASPVLIFHSDLLEVIEGMRGELPQLKTFVVIEPEKPVAWATEYEAYLDSGDPSFRVDLDAVDEDAPASIYFSHGAYGGYRGAVFTHRALYLHALTTLIMGRYFEYDTMCNLIPSTEANGFGLPHAMVAVAGTQIVLHSMNISLILETIQEEKVTRLTSVPALLNAICHHPYFSDYDISSLQYVVITGAGYTPEQIAEFERVLDCRVEGAYGQIETGPFIGAAGAKSYFLEDDEVRVAAQASAGLPAVGVRLRVVDDEGGDVPWDGKSEGEIIARTNWILKEYHQRPDLNEEKLIDGWFHTGDLGTVDEEGYLRIVGEKSRR